MSHLLSQTDGVVRWKLDSRELLSSKNSLLPLTGYLDTVNLSEASTIESLGQVLIDVPFKVMYDTCEVFHLHVFKLVEIASFTFLTDGNDWAFPVVWEPSAVGIEKRAVGD